MGFTERMFLSEGKKKNLLIGSYALLMKKPKPKNLTKPNTFWVSELSKSISREALTKGWWGQSSSEKRHSPKETQEWGFYVWKVNYKVNAWGRASNIKETVRTKA